MQFHLGSERVDEARAEALQRVYQLPGSSPSSSELLFRGPL